MSFDEDNEREQAFHRRVAELLGPAMPEPDPRAVIAAVNQAALEPEEQITEADPDQ